MVIENIMYFALGLLAAGLMSLIILPAVWKRAVRLTKRRIEAATPITMAEFRADKDQLRAEFALTTRKLEITVDTLRQRLAEQLGDYNQKRSDVAVLQAEREQHRAIIAELETRGQELLARVTELERESTDLAHRLRLRDRESELRDAELTTLRDAVRAAPSQNTADEASVQEGDNRVTAEARIASTESRINEMLTEPADQLLVDKLNLEAREARLRLEVSSLEAAILADWTSDRLNETALRRQLNDIAAGVSQLVYAPEPDTAPPPDAGESLFDRVQRFAEDGEGVDTLPNPSATGIRPGSVTDRMAALKELQDR